MREKQIYPYCPECVKAERMGDVEDCQLCIAGLSQIKDAEILKGCSICFSPLVKNYPVLCSDPNCNGYSITGVAGLSLSIWYKSNKVFYVDYPYRTVSFPDLYDSDGRIQYFPSHPEKIRFMKDLFFKIFTKFVDCDTYFRVLNFNFNRVGKLE